jgi:hypothetical protein
MLMKGYFPSMVKQPQTTIFPLAYTSRVDSAVTSQGVGGFIHTTSILILFIPENRFVSA